MNKIDTENIFSGLTRLNKILAVLLMILSLMVIFSVYLEKRGLDAQCLQEKNLEEEKDRLGLLSNLYQALSLEKKNVDELLSPLDDLKTTDGLDRSPANTVRRIAENKHMVLDWIDDISEIDKEAGKGKIIGLSLIGSFFDFHRFILALMAEPFIGRISDIQIHSGSAQLDIIMDIEFCRAGEKEIIPANDKTEKRKKAGYEKK
jgi:Tfp pilus assembly protein PilO